MMVEDEGGAVKLLNYIVINLNAALIWFLSGRGETEVTLLNVRRDND